MNNVFTGVIDLEKKLLAKNEEENLAPPISSDTIPDKVSENIKTVFIYNTDIVPEVVSEEMPEKSADIVDDSKIEMETESSEIAAR